MGKFKLHVSFPLFLCLCNFKMSYSAGCGWYHNRFHNGLHCVSIHANKLNTLLEGAMKKNNFSALEPIDLDIQSVRFESKTDIPTNWFTVNMSVNFLHLENIPTVCGFEMDAFNKVQFQKLEHLELVRMNLKFLPSGVFKGLDKLQYLYMDYVAIEAFDKDTLKSLPNLQTFTMDNCGTENVKLNSIFGVAELRFLVKIRISNCNLFVIEESLFSNLPSLRELCLNANQINEIEAKAFYDILGTLTILQLEFNNLTTLPYGIFQTDRSNDILIRFSPNPWHCDRRMMYLWNFVRNISNEHAKHIICETPSKLFGRDLKFISSEDLDIAGFIQQLTANPSEIEGLDNEFGGGYNYNLNTGNVDTDAAHHFFQRFNVLFALFNVVFYFYR